MKKSVAIILVTVMLICFSSVTTYQYNRIKQLENIIQTKDSKFQSVKIKLANAQSTYTSIKEDNTRLYAKIEKLESKISKYKRTISKLKKKIKHQAIQIDELSNKLSESQKSYIATVSRLEVLEKIPNNKLTKTDVIEKKKLSDKKDKLTQVIDMMYVERNAIKENKEHLEYTQTKYQKKEEKLALAKLSMESKSNKLEIPNAQILPEYKINLNLKSTTTQTPANTMAAVFTEYSDKQGTSSKDTQQENKEELKLKKLNKILQETWVNYYNIKLLKSKDGKPIRRLSRKKNNWNFTKVRFDIFSKSMKDISGGEFQIQIIDAKTKKPLPSEEGNPKFPNSKNGSNGVDFIMNNQKLRLTLSNHQLKKGKDYYLLVLYKFEGKLYPIANSKLPIIKNKKAIF